MVYNKIYALGRYYNRVTLEIVQQLIIIHQYIEYICIIIIHVKCLSQLAYTVTIKLKHGNDHPQKQHHRFHVKLGSLFGGIWLT